MENTKPRIDYWDNVKGFLILLVVFGHLLEQLPDGKNTPLYKLIYSFHMPLFVFCSGYLSSYSPKKILKRLLLPYCMLQIVCCIFTFQEIQMTTPYWVLWYLPALAAWRITIPFLDGHSTKTAPFTILACALCACLFGFDHTVGYYGTLSRIVVFYPYFIAGYYGKNIVAEKRGAVLNTKILNTKILDAEIIHAEKSCFPKILFQKSKRISIISVLILLLVAGAFLIFSPHFEANWLYEADSYRNGNYNVFFRAAHYLIAMLIGSSILILMPKRKTIFTAWGYASFPIYLTHIVITPAVRILFCASQTGRLFQYIVCTSLSMLFCMAASLKFGKSAC